MKPLLLISLLSLHLSCIPQGGALAQSSDSFRVGISYGGGVIFFIDSTGQHGLIVTKTDFSEKAAYGCPKLETYANSPGNGVINTILIAKHCGNDAAGYLCDNLEIDGFQDWYLPSINELALLYKSMLQPDFLSNSIYLSSTECSDCRRKFLCWAFDFERGKRITTYKDKPAKVRAIRRF